MPAGILEYREFDSRIRDIAATPLAKTDIRGLASLVAEAIDALPQADSIPAARRVEWFERTANSEIQRHTETTGARPDLPELLDNILWHVRRLSGVGGSDAGVILLHNRGLPGSFTTARNIAAQKLLIAAPQPGNEFTQRGTRAEPWLRRILLHQTGAQTDIEDLERLRSFRDETRPWRIGTPDDFLRASAALAGFHHQARRIMIDYKAPGEDEFAKIAKTGVPIEYAAQLSHYARICEAAGIESDALGLAAFDSRRFHVNLIPYEEDPDFARELDAACHGFWNDHVLEGTLPPPLDDYPELPAGPDTVTAASRLAALKAVIDALDKHRSDLTQQLENLCSGATGKLSVPTASYTRKRVWNTDTLLDLAKQAGIPADRHLVDTALPDSARAVELLSRLASATRAGNTADMRAVLDGLKTHGVPALQSLDTGALLADVEHAGLDPAAARGEDARFAISRRKADLTAVSELRREAGDLADSIVDYLDDIALAAEQPDAHHEIPEPV